MYSGLDVGDHGLHYSYQRSAADQRLRYRHDFGSPTLAWERIAAAGHRVLVIDPYEQAPPRHFGGYAVSGWQFESVLNLERWSVPHGWCRGYQRRLGGRRRSTRCSAARARGPSSRAAARCWGRRRGSATSPRRSSAVSASTSSSDADLIVVSPLGMRPDTSRADLLPEMLALVLAGDGNGAGKRAAQAGSRIWFVRTAVPTSVRAAVARAAGACLSCALTTRLSTSGIDWRQARAFVLPGDAQGQIRLNVRGREREGIVDPDDVDASRRSRRD